MTMLMNCTHSDRNINMIKLNLACGVTNHTHATLTQITKMHPNLKAENIMVIDQNTEKYGAFSLADSIDGPTLIYFDKLIEQANQIAKVEPVPPEAIFTEVKNMTSTWSKIEQLRWLDANFMDLDELGVKVPSFVTINSSNFVRRDRVHGGKSAGMLHTYLNCPPNEELVISETADPYVFDRGITVQGSVEDGKVVSVDVVYSPSKFKRYDDFWLSSRCLSEDVEKYAEGWTPYNPNLKFMDSGELADRLFPVIQMLVDIFGVTNGQISPEFFCNEDFNQLFYIESNFRVCDISMSCCKYSWGYMKREFEKLGVFDD